MSNDPNLEQDKQDAIDAGHDRSNPSGIPDAGSRLAQPVLDKHHEESHVDPPEAQS